MAIVKKDADKILLSQFFLGKLKGKKLLAFLKKAKTDSHFTEKVNRKANFDSICTLLSSEITRIIDHAALAEWATSLLPEDQVRQDGDTFQDYYTQEEWKTIIGDAFSHADTSKLPQNQHTTMSENRDVDNTTALPPVHPFTVPKSGRFSQNDRFVRFLIAAIVFLSVLSGLAFFSFFKNMHPFFINQRTPVAINSPADTVPAEPPPNNISFSSDTLLDSIPTTTETHIKHRVSDMNSAGQKKINIHKHAYVLAETESVMDVPTCNDSTILVTMQSGTVLFSVMPNSYTSFIVQTPSAKIDVKGTVFRVTVNDGETFVSVERGSVQVAHRATGLTRDIDAGNGAMVNADSLLANIAEKIQNGANDRNLFHQFTRKLPKTAAGNVPSTEPDSSFEKKRRHRQRITIYQSLNDPAATDSVLLSYIQRYGISSLPDSVLYIHATQLRTNNHYQRAYFWYENIVAEGSESAYHGDAFHWAMWCMIQQRIHNQHRSVLHKNEHMPLRHSAP